MGGGLHALVERFENAVLLEADELQLVRSDGFGELLDQGAELAELGGQRLVRRSRPFRDAVGDPVGVRFERGGAAAKLGHLAGEVAGAAGQVGDLAADIGAVGRLRCARASGRLIALGESMTRPAVGEPSCCAWVPSLSSSAWR